MWIFPFSLQVRDSVGVFAMLCENHSGCGYDILYFAYRGQHGICLSQTLFKIFDFETIKFILE